MKPFTEEEIKKLESTDPLLRPEQAAIEALRSGVGVTLGMVLQARRALTEAKLQESGESAYLQKSDLINFVYRSEFDALVDNLTGVEVSIYGLYSVLLAKNIITEKEFTDVLRHGEILPQSAVGTVQ